MSIVWWISALKNLVSSTQVYHTSIRKGLLRKKKKKEQNVSRVLCKNCCAIVVRRKINSEKLERSCIETECCVRAVISSGPKRKSKSWRIYGRKPEAGDCWPEHENHDIVNRRLKKTPTHSYLPFCLYCSIQSGFPLFRSLAQGQDREQTKEMSVSRCYWVSELLHCGRLSLCQRWRKPCVSFIPESASAIQFFLYINLVLCHPPPVRYSWL